MKRRAHLVDMGAVAPDRLMERLAANAKLLRPVGDVGAHLGIDDLGVVRAFYLHVLMLGVRGVLFGGLFVLVFGVVMGQVFLFLCLRETLDR